MNTFYFNPDTNEPQETKHPQSHYYANITTAMTYNHYLDLYRKLIKKGNKAYIAIKILKEIDNKMQQSLLKLDNINGVD